MARSRFLGLEPERQERILRAAGVEFAAHGYGGASLGRITEAAEISRGALYYYFTDKEDLFVTTVEAATERLVAAFDGLAIGELTAEEFWDAVLRLGLAIVELRASGAWFLDLALAFPRLRDEHAAARVVRPALERGRRLTRDLLRRGQELGRVRSDLPLDLLVEVTLAVDEAGNRWFTEHHAEYDDPAFRALAAARLDLMRDMLDAAHEGWDE